MLPLLLMMIFAVLLTLGGAAGGLFYLAKSNRLSPALIGGGANAMAPPPSAAYSVVLEPLLVNLADANGHGYLRAGVTLRVLGPEEAEAAAKADPTSKKVESEVSAPLRDIALDVLGRQQASDLLVPDGKEKLKVELKKAFLERDPYVKVTDIYFTEFLVQQ